MSAAVVMYGGGSTSFATARIAAERHGRENTTLLFADTLAEDEDLHRFNAEVSAHLGIPITRVCDGRTPEQVDVDSRWLSNARIAKCSHVLKQVPCRMWMEANGAPDAVIYVGLDWTELHRVPPVRHWWRPWQVEFPLAELTGKGKDDWNRELRALGIAEPRLYREGYPHNNSSWASFLANRSGCTLAGVCPVRLAATNAGAAAVRGGETIPLRLSVVRAAVESQPSLLDLDDWGGCGCFVDVAVEGSVHPGGKA